MHTTNRTHSSRFQSAASSRARRPFAFLLPMLFVAACSSGTESNAEVAKSTSDEIVGPTGVERLPRPTLGEGEVYDVELADKTDFLDDHPDIEAVEIGKDRLVFTPRQAAELKLQVGRHLLSRQNLFMRKVVGIERKDGKVIVTTSQAKLTDVFKRIRIEGDAKLSSQVLPSAKVSPAAPSVAPKALFNINDTTSKTFTKSYADKIYDTSNFDVSVNASYNTTVKFWFKFYWDVNWGPDDIEFGTSVKVTVDADAKATATATASYSTGSREKNIISLGQIPWSIGVVSGSVDLDVVLNYSLTATGSATAVVDVGFDNLMVKAGAKWKKGDGWDNISDYTAPTWHNDATFSSRAGVSGSLYPAFEAAVLIFGIGGPELAFGPKFDASATYSSSTRKACISADAALKAEANGVVDILGVYEVGEVNLASWTIHDFGRRYNVCTTLSSSP